jgi:hypothetical protein
MPLRGSHEPWRIAAVDSHMDKHHVNATIYVAVALLCITSNTAFGITFLKATVELDGQVVFRSTYERLGSLDRATVWRFWGKEPENGEVLPPFAASEADPLRATLEGSLYLKIEYAWGAIVDGHAHELTLRRTHTGANLWFLPSSEVERIAELSGIPPVPFDYEMLRTLFYLCVAVVGFGILMLAPLWRAKREQARQATTREEHNHTPYVTPTRHQEGNCS